MLYKIIYYIFKLFPRLKKWFWKKWYTIFANKISDPDLRFMNYGYYSNDLNIELSAEEEKDRYSIHLYHHVASQINLTGLKVLEVGSGRGGGCSYVTRYLKPSKMYGIDISHSAVDICNKIYNIENLNFMQGDSENLPFEDGVITAIILDNVIEHFYDIPKVITELVRVSEKGTIIKIITPHFSSLSSWVDPTHIHHLSYFSFDHFEKDSVSHYIGKGIKIENMV